MGFKITPLTPAIGALIEGISLSDPLAEPQIEAIYDALLQHQAIFFPNQSITPQQQHAFAKHFGDLHVHPIYPNLGPQLEEVMVLDSDGDHPPDNDNWHTDVTFIDTPPMGTILAAKELPPCGGDTLWSSGMAAFDALSAPMQSFLLGLKAEHTILKSFSKPGLYQYAGRGDPRAIWEEAVRKNPAVVHPVVRTQPQTQRKALFVNKGHTSRILHLTQAESDGVLEFLFAHAARPEFSLRWRWRVGDVAFWDNRVTQHYGVADYLPHRRLMHRVTILGDRPY